MLCLTVQRALSLTSIIQDRGTGLIQCLFENSLHILTYSAGGEADASNLQVCSLNVLVAPGGRMAYTLVYYRSFAARLRFTRSETVVSDQVGCLQRAQ